AAQRPADKGVQVGGVSGQGQSRCRSPSGGRRPAGNCKQAPPTTARRPSRQGHDSVPEVGRNGDRGATEARPWPSGGGSRSGPPECRDMAFDDELGLLGFRLAQERRDGTRTFSLARNRYLTYWLHVPADDGVALFTWEFALGEY